MSIPDKDVLFQLAKGFKLTKMSGKANLMVLWDKNNIPLAKIEFSENIIRSVKPYRKAEINENGISALQNFVRQNHFKLSNDAAVVLKLSVINKDGDEEYLTSSELTKAKISEIFQSYEYLSINFNHVKKRSLTIPHTAKPCRLKLTHAAILKVLISSESQASLDFRDNKITEELVIEGGFKGRLNFSRSNLLNIKLGDNCHCDITCVQSGKCFTMSMGDIYSGNLSLTDSCFHHLKVGYYCYATIRLKENWGKKDVIIGDSFRGVLTIDAVQAENLEIGEDCRGQVSIKDSDKKGIRNFEIADEFNGEIDLNGCQNIEKITFGAHTNGNINLSNCPSLQSVKFEEDFSGKADMQNSGVVYVRAKDGCSGRFVLLNCDNLCLLRVPKDKKADVLVERSPKIVKKDEQNLYCYYDDKELPPHMLTPFYDKWFKKAKDMLSKRFS